MDAERFTKAAPGRLVPVANGAAAFVPAPLPPTLSFDHETVRLLDRASSALGVLSGTGRLLPNAHLLIQPYLRREAVLSSRIEGTRSTVSDVYAAEAGQTQLSADASDVDEVRNYVGAYEYGLRRIRELPLSLRLIRELHAELMDDVRGGDQQPGRFRASQNFIGPPGASLAQATYVPPPPAEMDAALEQLELFLYDDALPPLVQIALVHYQFEAIHPFLDGNGRVGRLLVSLFLSARELLSQPLLYLSAYFERTRSDYYELLLRVSTHGDWGSWLRYFLEGVRVQATDAVDDAQRIVSLQDAYRQLLIETRARSATHELLDNLFVNPYATVSEAARLLGVSAPTARAAIGELVRLEILAEVSGRRWGKVYLAQDLLAALRGDQRL
jgi:Fic family protein